MLMVIRGPNSIGIHRRGSAWVIDLLSDDGMNRLNIEKVKTLTREISGLSSQSTPLPLVLTGSGNFFSVGADLNEINQLSGASAYDFALAGQRLMNAVDNYSATVIAAINGYCMGGGLDLALACDFRICSPNSIFGHRGAALGIMTGWGGTQRLPRLLGKARAMKMFLTAEKLSAQEARRMGLVDLIADDPVQAALEQLHRG
jgi:enoyl-CoA hydratase/carnithine racemase